MWNESQPLTVSELARRLDVEPFEVVRLLVAAGKPRDTLLFADDATAALAAYAGIERWWEALPEPVDGADPRKTLLQHCLRRLLAGKYIGDRRTRQDNLWRDLPRDLREFMKDAVEVLIEENVLHLRAEATGLQISVRAEASERAKAMSEGKELVEDLRRLWS
jgi:hypothetical protein